MPLEDLTGPDKYPNALVREWPLDTDDVAEGAAHIRGMKNVTLNTWPNLAGEVLADENELNKLDGLQATTAELDRNQGTLRELQAKHGIYSGRVNATDIGASDLPAGFSAEETVEGYRIIHNLGTLNYSFVVGWETGFPANAVDHNYNIITKLANDFFYDIYDFNAGSFIRLTHTFVLTVW